MMHLKPTVGTQGRKSITYVNSKLAQTNLAFPRLQSGDQTDSSAKNRPGPPVKIKPDV